MSGGQDYAGKRRYVGDVARGYEDARAGRRRWRHEQEIVRGFVEEMPEGSSVLDVPFGTGRFADFYLQRNLEVFGVDISPDMLEQARQRLGDAAARVTLEVGDAEQLPLGPDSVDYVVSNRFLKWLPSLEVVERVLGEFARVARRRIILQASLASDAPSGGFRPTPRRLRKALRRWIERIRGRESGAPNRYRDADLRAVFGRLGLQVVRTLDDPRAGRSMRYYVLEPRSGP